MERRVADVMCACVRFCCASPRKLTRREVDHRSTRVASYPAVRCTLEEREDKEADARSESAEEKRDQTRERLTFVRRDLV